MEMVEQVLVVGLLLLGGNYWWCLCGNLLGLDLLGNSRVNRQLGKEFDNQGSP